MFDGRRRRLGLARRLWRCAELAARGFIWFSGNDCTSVQALVAEVDWAKVFVLVDERAWIRRIREQLPDDGAFDCAGGVERNVHRMFGEWMQWIRQWLIQGVAGVLGRRCHV